MSANQQPIFGKTPNFSGVTPSAANTKSDGTGTIGTDMFVAFTAGANGSFVERCRMMPTASTANSSTTATVGRIFICSIATGTPTAANCHLWDELTLPSITADSSTGKANGVESPMGFTLPANWVILVTNHAAPAANTGWKASVVGIDY